MKELQVSAFQMDQNAILTVKDGDELVTSGVFTVRDFGSDNRATVDIDFGELGWQPVKVTAREFDPAKVGTGPAGQRRFYWSGVLELED